MSSIHISDIESAINFWRKRKPASEAFALAPEVQGLAEVYAWLVFEHLDDIDEFSLAPETMQAWLGWYETTPDTPCIAICSTSQGDAMCKGCGRSFSEVQHWTDMSPVQKRLTWRRITLQASAWRFNRYAERAAERLRDGAAAV